MIVGCITLLTQVGWKGCFLFFFLWILFFFSDILFSFQSLFCVFLFSDAYNGLKLKEGGFRLDVRGKFFPMRVVRCWTAVQRGCGCLVHPWRCSRPGWMGPWAAWAGMKCGGWWPCLWRGVGASWSLRSLPTQAILWFYDSMTVKSKFKMMMNNSDNYQRTRAWLVTPSTEKNNH